MSRSRKRRNGVIAALLLLVLLVLAGRILNGGRDTPPVRPTALLDRLAGMDAAAPQERRQQLRQLREVISQMSPKEQKEFWAERRRRFRDWLDDFFHSSGQEQVARLDSEIDRMNAFRKQWGASATEPQGPGWATELSEEDLQRRQKLWLDLTGPEERALVARYFGMLSRQQQQSGQGGCYSPWGDAPT
jgi:hypothetical protein